MTALWLVLTDLLMVVGVAALGIGALSFVEGLATENLERAARRERTGLIAGSLGLCLLSLAWLVSLS